ncbi:MAG: hypothetical protein ACOCRU_01325, partial [bacterium]
FKTISCWSKLDYDPEGYAAYPDGIPEGTSIGEYLGNQARVYMDDMGMDFIWLSNGFGFSSFPWAYFGVNFDDDNFGRANYEEMKQKYLGFWEDLKEGCGDYPIYVRGTNMGTAADLASDCVPLLDIYENEYIDLPAPNSPWPALDSDHGIEISGFMSRNALLPGDDFIYRAYPNDPWYPHNPWWHQYDRNPHDFYCPLSVARINGEGEAENPGSLSVLTIDDERGNLIEECPQEITPHIKKAVRDFPDEPGIITWLYPFREYHQIMEQTPEHADTLFFGDWYIRNAINHGLPLNTVISTDDFLKLKEKKQEILDETILLTPVLPVKTGYMQELIAYIKNGGQVIFYGPIKEEQFADLLNIKTGDGLEGEMLLETDLKCDSVASGDWNMEINHMSTISGGPVREQIKNPEESYTEIDAICRQDNLEKIYALTRSLPEWQGGKVSWVRGSLPYKLGPEGPRNKLPILTEDYFETSMLLRMILEGFGYSFIQNKFDESRRPAYNFISRHDNGFFFSGYKPDTTVSFTLEFPQGAPLIIGRSAVVENNKATYSLNTSFHEECRIFVKQEKKSVVTCKKINARLGRFLISNLQAADVVVYLPSAAVDSDQLKIMKNGEKVDVQNKIEGKCLHLENITGELKTQW